jgi:hypothetical protein
MWEKRISKVVIALSPITLLNFIAFLIVTYHLGGDAVNGKIVSGHYYVGSHGQYSEVGFGTFLYSAIHTCATVLTFVLFISLLLVVELWGEKKLPGGPA